MLDFLYYLCIAPFESAMRAVLFFSHSLTGSWGASLILMSITVNIALIPIYHIAERWQEAERSIQHAMAQKLGEIREVFRGRERYMYTKALYRLYGYSPLHALRTSFGLLIQIPFFFAAYHLLNAAPELVGVSWFFLPDLSQPDGLAVINGTRINMLPFIMTAVNLLSAYVYTSRLAMRAKVQLYTLAAVFLIFLYTSSSALLIYWTCNNIFSVFKNLLYTQCIYKNFEGEVCGKKRAIPAYETVSVKKDIPEAIDIIVSFLGTAMFITALVVRKYYGETGTTVILAMVGACITWLAWLRCQKGTSYGVLLRSYRIFPFFIATVVTICAWKLTSFKKIDTTLGWWFHLSRAFFFGGVAGWLCARKPLQPLFCRLIAFIAKRIASGKVNSLYFSSVVVMAIAVCWYIPAVLYESDPDFFYESMGALAGRLTFRGGVLIALAGLLYHWTAQALRPFMAIVWAFSALSVLLFMFIAIGDYGTMDEFILQDPSLLRTRLAFLVDLGVILFASGILWVVLLKDKVKQLITLLQGVSMALCGVALYLCIAVQKGDSFSFEQASFRLPEYNDALLGFSQTGENTVIIMLDAFTGGHVERILDETPKLRQGLDGFTWYPDTVASGSATLLSVPSILGGEQFTPLAINARPNESLKSAMHEGFAVLPEIFINAGYSVALADVDTLVPSLYGKICSVAEKTLVVGKSMGRAYTSYWRNKHGLPSSLPEARALFLGSVGLFRAAPWVLRNHIYNNGSWLNFQAVGNNPSEGAYAMLDLLPDSAHARQEGNTLKYIASQITHYPWRLDSACMPSKKNEKTVGKDRVIAEHLNNERCALLALVRWFDWMKEAGVYDNTQIILVSDHDGDDSSHFGAEFDDIRPVAVPLRPDALLLVKQRNSRGELKTDFRLMASSDVVGLVCSNNNPCFGQYPDPLADRETPRVRTHSSGRGSLRRHEKHRFLTKDYRVNGTMFERKNWSLMETGQ